MSSPKPGSTTPTGAQHKTSPPFDPVISTILHRILLALSCRSLLPTDLARLASAAATLTRAHAYAQTAELQRQLLRAKINKLTPPPEEDFDSPEGLERLRARVRAIYGIDWDFANPPADDPSWEPPPDFIGEYIPEGSSVPTIRSAHVKMCDMVRQSETSAPPSRAVLCPDIRREISNPDSLPTEICGNTGQCETSAAASPAHLPASDVQPMTSNSQLLASTSPPRQAPSPKTHEECVESETSDDKSGRTQSKHPPERTPSPLSTLLVSPCLWNT